jgi:hypothetical protein
VVAFYSAVHYANAFLWEAHRFRPANHDKRTDRLYSESRLNPVYENYTILRDHAWKARYWRRYRIPYSDTENLIKVDLAAVKDAVELALGLAASS